MFFFEWLLSLILQLANACEALAPAVYFADLERHYARVEHELRAFPPAGLDASQRAARARIIENLRRYRLAGVFGVQASLPDQDGGRSFAFIDGGGRRCAVAYLLDHTGHGDLTLAVARARNDALVAELADHEELGTWLAAHGITLEEAARIQGPPGGMSIGRGRDITPNAGPGSGSGRGVPFRPGDAIGGGTRGGLFGSNPSSTSSPASGPIGSGPTGGASPGAFAMPGLALGVQVDWMQWWSWNRSRVLDEPALPIAEEALPIGRTAVQDDGGEEESSDRRSRLSLAARALLRHRDAEVRASAAFALGRSGSAEDIEALLALREDASLDVREEALLALGNLAATRAQHALLRIATSDVKVDSQQRAFALLALASSRVRQRSAAMDAPLAELLAPKRGDATSGEALALAQILSPLPSIDAWLRASLENEKAPLHDRCRAAEALGGARDSVALTALIHALGARHPELRASAAAALAAHDHELTLPSVLTAYEVERELRVRGLLLIAAGSQGGDRASAFLIEELRSGPKSLRPWAALALGMLARSSRCTPEISTALRTAIASEANRDARSAHLLALGLARDSDLVAAVDAELEEEPSATARVLAGTALAAEGSDAARARLRRAIAEDPCPTTRQLLAVELAEIATSEDGPRLREILAEVLDPAIRASLTRTLGRNADRATAAALLAELEGKEPEPRVLAAALEAVAWSLSSEETPLGYRWTARTSPDLFPSWARVAIHRVL